ncbi:MAG: hypothetical protein P9F19_18330 [Candidatus Contendobacter sp.]|nr:hypothetical protein [Candidatus Contendobacter sp.]MDG4559325.1 hypothetical protein [Candidatus Contendobacter sp.]
MNRQEQEQFTVYAAETAIPRYQRAWVWGLAALAILLCGLAAGWLMGGAGSSIPVGARSGVGAVDGAALLARREAVNGELRGRIARLEEVLRGDVCAPAALEALQPTSR